jgi:hypothetical protein
MRIIQVWEQTVMPFQKGQISNPGGRKKAIGLSRAVRKIEGLKTWVKLLQIRDGEVLERKVISKDSAGQPIEADVVPSAKVLADVCLKILAYCWGLPVAVGNDELKRRIVELEERLKERPWQSH